MELLVGRKYINRIYELREVVIITKITENEMWGMHSKENVKIIHYKTSKNWSNNKNTFDFELEQGYCFNQKTTEHNFISKYIDLEDLRDDKLNTILNT